jgi:hypothetical protein
MVLYIRRYYEDFEVFHVVHYMGKYYIEMVGNGYKQ